MFLGRSERTYFVNVLLKLIDRGQYSKDEHLSETVAAATSILSYVEPTLVLPFLASRFHLALETVSSGACVILGPTMLKFDNDPLFKGYLVVSSSDYASFTTLTCLFPTFVSSQMTATHQLKTAVMSVAYAGRSLCLTSLSRIGKQEDCGGGDDAYVDLLTISLSNALLGMDANDPPKTLATMQLLGSIFSNVRVKALISLSHLCFIVL
jgi:proteasome activator subunit 4